MLADSGTLLVGWTAPIGAWFLTYMVHSSLLLGLAWVSTRRLIQSALFRDLVWKAALVGGIGTASLQQMVFSDWAPLVRVPASALAHGPRNITSGPSSDRSLRSEWAPTQAPVGTPTETQVAANPAARMAAAQDSNPGSWGRAVQVGLGVVGLMSAVLVLVYFLRLFRVYLRMGRRPLAADHALHRMLDALRGEVHYRRRVRLTTAHGLVSPVALGASEICVPDAALNALEPDQQRSMLAHELAHLARWDPLWLTSSCLLERLFFFQPLNRVARKRIQESAEFLADEWAVRRTGSGLSLATCLVRVAEWIDAAPQGVPVAGMAEERSQLVNRVRRLVEEVPMKKTPSRRWLAIGTLSVLALTAVIAPRFTVARQVEAPRKRKIEAEQQAELARLNANLPRLAAVHTAARASLELAKEAQFAAIAAAAPRGFGPMALIGRGRGQGRDTSGTIIVALSAALHDPEVEVRRAAVHSLNSLEDRRAIPALIDALKDSDLEVRAVAANSLASFHDERAIPALTALVRDPSKEVRQAALRGLAQFPKTAPREPFESGLKDADAEVRVTAAEALGERKETGSVSLLAGLLTDRNREVRGAAVRALGEIGGASVRVPLVQALRDADPEIRAVALEALGAVLGENEDESNPVAPPDGVLQMLKDPNANVRKSSAELLGRLHAVAAVSGLRDLLQDPNAEVREAAVQGLAEIRNEAAIDALVGALKSKDVVVRRAAAEALGQR